MFELTGKPEMRSAGKDETKRRQWTGCSVDQTAPGPQQPTLRTGYPEAANTSGKLAVNSARAFNSTAAAYFLSKESLDSRFPWGFSATL